MEILKDKGSHKILAIMYGIDREDSLGLIELAGRTAYQSREKINKDSSRKFVEMLRKKGHESVLEHSAMTVEFNNVSRGFTHELVRHRLVSYTQESTRYVDESEFRIVIPPTKNPDEKIELELADKHTLKISFREWMQLNEQMYRALRKTGWVPQDARQVLPIGIKSQIVMTANFREWRHVFKIRCFPAAHWEIRRVMVNLLKEIKKLIPVIFDDFVISKDGQSAAIEK